MHSTCEVVKTENIKQTPRLNISQQEIEIEGQEYLHRSIKYEHFYKLCLNEDGGEIRNRLKRANL